MPHFGARRIRDAVNDAETERPFLLRLTKKETSARD